MPTTPANPPNNSQPAADTAEPAGTAASRRAFLKRGAQVLGAGVTTFVLCDLVDLTKIAEATETTLQSGGEFSRTYDWRKHRYVYLVDTRKCLGCGSCVRACSRENNVPRDYFRTWVERYEVSRTGNTHVDSPDGGIHGFAPLVTGDEVTKAFFFPKLCCHCTRTPCVQLCPVGASFRTLEGVILVDQKRCIGCGYCVQACPYGSRFIHPETHVASKCTLCYHRLTRGLMQACVQACPVGARRLGDLKKDHDEVAEIIATQPVQVLQPELLTEPNCYYLGLSREAR